MEGILSCSKILSQKTPEMCSVFLIYIGYRIIGQYTMLGTTLICVGAIIIFLTGIFYLYEKISNYRGDIEKEIRTDSDKRWKEIMNKNKKQYEEHNQQILNLMNVKLQSNETSIRESIKTDISFGNNP